MMTDKEAQLKAKLLKMKLAVKADGVSTAKGKVKKLKKKYVDPNPQAETPEEIMQSAESAGREPTYIAQDHGHRISFRSHSAGNFRTASLNEQSGKYAKYWLLNAKDTNGNGWGIASHTAKENMKKFIGRPLVVTASSWHGASEYGDEYEHPYLPTNDISAILDHQEKFRVGSIVDVVEDSHGDWFASVEMLPKFASSRLPPFCSPAIYQLDASEAEGQISKWEALHLAALTENPAYGARIALLKGTCVGTGSECKVQFKVAKQATIECPKKKQKISRLKSKLAAVGLPDGFGKDPKKFKDFKDFLDNFNQDAGPPEHERKSPFPLPKYFEKDYEAFHNHVQDSAFRLEDAQEAGIDLEDENFSHGDDVSQSWNDVSKENQDKLRPYYQKHLSKELSWQKDPSLYTSGELPKEDQTYTKPGFHKNLTPMFENEPDGYKEINPKDIVSKTYDSTYDEPSKYSKLKARLAGLGDENMTYQNSKKVKLHKTKNMGKNDKD